jgi:putative transcriptional regulator
MYTTSDGAANGFPFGCSESCIARYLNLTVGYIWQLERGVKRPTGPALVLLDVSRRKGIEAII